MSRANQKRSRPASEVHQDAIVLLRDAPDSEALRAGLEELSKEYAFPGLTHLWGPELYARAPLMFRPFILAHFSFSAFEKKWKYRTVEWKGQEGQRLEAWLQEVDRANDIELYRRLYSWRLLSQHKHKGDKVWVKDLLARFEAAPDRQTRRQEMLKHDLFYWLDEPAAVTLYKKDAKLAAPFILRHLPRHYSLFTGEKRALWTYLADLAKQAGDDELYFSLYRKQAPLQQWRQDALDLCRREADTDKLLRELRRRHLEIWDKDLGVVFTELLESRGEELFPYVIPELNKVLRGWFRTGFDNLMALADRRGWWELWGALTRACATPKEFEKAVHSCLELPAPEGKRKLLRLAGAGLELNFPGLGIARLVPLSDKAACAVYAKYPDILRGPMRAQLTPNASDAYDKLTGQLLGCSDDELLDYLASRLVVCLALNRQPKLAEAVERLAAFYEAMQRDEARFARRAAAVLGQVPAYMVWMYDRLIRENRLARLLYERSAGFYLKVPEALTDLLEAPEIHAQALAYRTLALNNDQARRQALDNLDVLLGTLLRPLHCRTRLLAFAALENAAHDPDAAARVVSRARDALGLPDSHYPKDQLVGLIGRLLFRHPGLRSPEETPVVYRRATCSA